MKIYILPVSKEFQPDKQNFRMPTHGQDWGVEQDFHSWLLDHSHLIASKPEEATWDYLPLYWNRCYINFAWGTERLGEIQNEILRLVSRNRPTFTICEYDVRQMQSFYDLCSMVVFTASRRGDSDDIDIPLLCSPHTPQGTKKSYLASFVGNTQTNGIRMEMKEKLGSRNDVEILDGNLGPKFFVRLMESSYVALAPRGHGGQSFRFYEALDLGIVPYHIGVPDTRPFKKWIDWESCSLYAATVDEVEFPEDRDMLERMGRTAKAVYNNKLKYGRWCDFVLKELEQL